MDKDLKLRSLDMDVMEFTRYAKCNRQEVNIYVEYFKAK